MMVGYVQSGPMGILGDSSQYILFSEEKDLIGSLFDLAKKTE